MKNYNKTVLGIVVSLGLVSGSVQASPFREFARKWAARGAAVGYWGALASPLVVGQIASHMYDGQGKLLDSLDKENNHPLLTPFKEYDEKRYNSVRTLLKEEGLLDLDNYRVNVLTPESVSRVQASLADVNVDQIDNVTDLYRYVKLKATEQHLEKNLYGSAYADSSLNAIVLPDKADHPFTEGTILDPSLSNQSDDMLAGIIAHEAKHLDENHDSKGVVIASMAPFAIHGISKSLYQKLIGIKQSVGHPTIIRSLLRMPQAKAVLGVAFLIEKWVCRRDEREADSNLKGSSKLARAAASQHHQLNSFENLSAEIDWDFANEQGSKHTVENDVSPSFVSDPLEWINVACMKYMSKEGYLNFATRLTKVKNLWEDHPSAQERAAYLNEWAEQAEAKQKKA